MAFRLTMALAKKDLICELPFCYVLLEDNAYYPWVFLVPKKANAKNMLDLTTEERMTLMREIEIVEKAMNVLFKPTQLNVAMIGNKTPQLHVHIICRFLGDIYWPGTVWGGRGRPYLSTMKAQTIERIKKEIKNQCQALQYSFQQD